MRTAFHEQLDSLTGTLSDMCGLAGLAMERATQALLQADLLLAEQVITDHDHLTRMQADSEATAFVLLALQSPVAGDLRVVVGSMQNVADAERMGGLALHVAKIARRRHPDLTLPEEVNGYFAEMGRIAVDLGNSAREVVLSGDVEKAAQIGREDEAMDHLHRHLFTMLMDNSGTTASRPPSTSRCWAGSTNASPTTPWRSGDGWSSRRRATRPRRDGPVAGEGLTLLARRVATSQPGVESGCRTPAKSTSVATDASASATMELGSRSSTISPTAGPSALGTMGPAARPCGTPKA